ncbi:MAG: alpha/beta fold hydrolase [Bacteroidales bacterium]|nr:alpha/beta fold hydrolase [Bacteroidales bacterium]
MNTDYATGKNTTPGIRPVKMIRCMLLLMTATFLMINALHAGYSLPRRAFIGVRLLEVTDSIAALNNVKEKSGVYVEGLAEGGTAAAIGLKAGDIILKANDVEAVSVYSFIDRIGRHQDGDPISLDIMRNGTRLRLEGTMTGFPPEENPYAEVVYDQVAFEDGYVRTIIHKPKEPGVYPVLFFIQGYPCAQVDNMGAYHPYTTLLEGFSKRGFVVVKTEKAGMGDSRSSRDCSEINLLDEVEIFTRSYNNLVNYDFVDTANVFVFGHSMGGVQAPMMAWDFDPKGIIVFGTVVRPWFEYLIEQTRVQRLLLGQDYLENEALHEQSIRFYYRFMIEKESPRELMKDPEMAAFLDRYWRYDEGGFMNGRHYTFWHQLQDTRLFKAWSQVNAHVLSLWGEGEFVAFNPHEHELIAEIVNHYNPGMATFMKVPNVDHGFIYVNDLQHAIAIRNDPHYRRNNIHTGIADLISDWMEEVMNR